MRAGRSQATRGLTHLLDSGSIMTHSADSSGNSSPRPYILVCHGDSFSRSALRQALEPLGRVECVDAMYQAVEALSLNAIDCLIMDIPADRREMGTLGRIAAAYSETRVLVLAQSLSFEAARDLVRMGVKDVLSLPLDPGQCADAVRILLSDHKGVPAGFRALSIAVASGKGGTGCTAIAANLAAVLAAHGTAVILDADAPPFGTVATAVDLEAGVSIAGLIRQRLSIEPRVLRRTTGLHPAGFSVLALWTTPGELTEMEDAVTITLDTLGGMYPFVVLDVGRPVLVPQRLLLRRAAVVIAVATLDLLALRNLRQLTDLIVAETGGAARLLPVLNRCDRDESYSVEQAAAALGQPFAAVLPYAPGLTRRLDRGELLMTEEPTAAWSIEVGRLASEILARRRDEVKSALG
jgi:pilus assembly protein CpaE